MVAMEVELKLLLEKLENVKCESVGKFRFYEGSVKNYPVVVCHCLVMSINAAIATYMAIEKYHPKAMISQGTAGAHRKDIHKGDLVIGEKCINIVSCRTPRKKEGEGSNSFEWELMNFISGEENRLVYQTGDKHLLELAKKVKYEDGKVHFGVIGSGDVWNQEADRILWLNQKYGTLCEEMEGIAVYKVANDSEIPVLGIRIISNNEILGENYDRNLAVKSQEFTHELVLKMIEDYNKEEK